MQRKGYLRTVTSGAPHFFSISVKKESGQEQSVSKQAHSAQGDEGKSSVLTASASHKAFEYLLFDVEFQ